MTPTSRSASPSGRRAFAQLRAAAVLVAVLAACSADDPSSPDGGGGGGGDDDRILWHVPGVGAALRPSVDASTVYFADADRQVVAIDKATGEVRWRASIDTIAPFPFGANTIVAGDVVAVGNGAILAFDRRTGAPRWDFSSPPAMDGDAFDRGDWPGLDFLLGDGSTIYAASLRNRAYAIDAASGELRWATQLPEAFDDATAAGPQLEDGVLFVGSRSIAMSGEGDAFEVSYAGAIVALDAATGRILWTHDFEAGYPGAVMAYEGLPAFHGPDVIAGVGDGRVHALDRATGAVRWTAPWVHPIPPAPDARHGDDRPVVVTGDVVVAGSASTGITVGLDAATGAERWRLTDPLIRVTRGAMTTDGQLAYLTTRDGTLHAIDGTTGTVRWSMRLTTLAPPRPGEPPRLSGALLDGDRLYVSGPDGFFALRR